MSSTPDERQRLEILLEQILDFKISEKDAAELEDLLSRNSDLRYVYSEYLETHAVLEYEGAVLAGRDPWGSDKNRQSPTTCGVLSGAKIFGEAADTKSIPFALRADLLKWKVSPNMQRVMAAAAVLLVAVAGWLFRVRTSGNTPYPIVATVVGASTRNWSVADGTGEVGGLLAAGERVFVHDGLLQLSLLDGASAIVEGPGEIEVEDSNHMSLVHGKVVAYVPRQASGFVVSTPAGHVVDVGTKFGVEVARDTEETTTVVFDGRVEVWKEISGLRRLALSAGESVTIIPGEIFPSKPAAAGARIPSFSLGLLSTGYVANVLQALPVLFHGFDTCDEHGCRATVRTVPFTGTAIMNAVRVEPMQELPVRKANNTALVFGGDGYVEVANGFRGTNLTDAYTLMIWVRVDKLVDQNIVLATDFRGPEYNFGSQLRVLKDGSLQHYCYCPPAARSGRDVGWKYLQKSRAALQVGKWHHVAASASSRTEMRLYIDGEEVADRVAVPQSIVKHYPRLLLGCSSGHEQEAIHHMQPFTGAMDELAVFDRSLDPEEIQQIYISTFRRNERAEGDAFDGKPFLTLDREGMTKDLSD